MYNKEDDSCILVDDQNITSKIFNEEEKSGYYEGEEEKSGYYDGSKEGLRNWNKEQKDLFYYLMNQKN